MPNRTEEALIKTVGPLAALGVGVGGAELVREGMSRPSMSEEIKRGVRDDSDKAEAIRRKKEASGGGGSESTARPKAYKKGGKVAGRLATRGYGIAKK